LILNQDCLLVKLNFWVFSCEIKVNKIKYFWIFELKIKMTMWKYDDHKMNIFCVSCK
jgi:hypothetical protein